MAGFKGAFKRLHVVIDEKDGFWVRSVNYYISMNRLAYVMLLDFDTCFKFT